MNMSKEMFVILMMVASLSFVVLFTLLQNLINNRKSRSSIEAKVVEIDGKYSRHIYFGNPSSFNRNPVYIITFRLKNGKKKVFTCPLPEYKWVELGDEGVLTHQGTRFICFKITIYRNDYS